MSVLRSVNKVPHRSVVGAAYRKAAPFLYGTALQKTS